MIPEERDCYEIIGKVDDPLGGYASAIRPGASYGPGTKWLLRVLPTNAHPEFYSLSDDLDMILLAWNPRNYPQIEPNLNFISRAEAERIARVCRGHFPFLMFKDGKKALQ
ncbi:MAG: hypothetical protein WCC85_10935 [Candidatus Sulfotelmatobacter sp.]